MTIIKVCVGSSCHIKGAPEIVELFQKNIAEKNLDDEIALVGSFCAGKCNRVGVTVTVDDDVYTGITPENFSGLWNDKILPKLEQNKEV